MRGFFIKKVALLTAIGAALALSACGGDDASNDLSDRLGFSDPSVRFVNAARGPYLSLYRNGSNHRIDLNDTPSASISKFKSFNDENSTFSVRSGTDQVGVAGSFNAINGHRYLVVAFSPRSLTETFSATENSGIDLQVLDDPYNRKASVKSTVRLVNAVFSGQQFDIYVTRPDQELGNPVVANFGYKTFWPASGNGAHKLENVDGRFRVRVTAAGNPGTILFDSKQIQLNSNADAVIVLAPVRYFSAAAKITTLQRGDLKIYVDDGNNKSENTLEIFDKK